MPGSGALSSAYSRAIGFEASKRFRMQSLRGACVIGILKPALMYRSISEHTYINTSADISIRPHIHKFRTCIHAYVHTYIHTYTHTQTYSDTQSHRPTDIQTYRHTDVHTSIHQSIHPSMHACMHACMAYMTHMHKSDNAYLPSITVLLVIIGHLRVCARNLYTNDILAQNRKCPQLVTCTYVCCSSHCETVSIYH